MKLTLGMYLTEDAFHNHDLIFSSKNTNVFKLIVLKKIIVMRTVELVDRENVLRKI